MTPDQPRHVDRRKAKLPFKGPDRRKPLHRRKNPRFRLLTGLEYKVSRLPDAEVLSNLDGLMTTHVQDASLGGLGALLEKFAPPESILEIHLSRPGHPGQKITIEARVLWCDKSARVEGGYRSGLEFLMPSEEALAAIMALLEKADKEPLK